MIKVLIADDQELIRESLKIILDVNSDIKVVGLAEDGRKVLDLLNKTLPDIILMDIRMPELDKLESDFDCIYLPIRDTLQAYY